MQNTITKIAEVLDLSPEQLSRLEQLRQAARDRRTIQINVRTDLDMRDWLDQYVKDAGTDKTAVVNEALRDYRRKVEGEAQS